MNVVRMVPPTAYAFAMRKRIFTTAAATLTTLPRALATGGPIFIIGCPGSGTGLLRLALNLHERIAVAPETGFMRAERASKFIPFWPFGGRWYRRLGLTEEELDVHLRGFYEGLFRDYAEREGKQRWGESTPWHVWHVAELARLFPDAVFAGVVRHPAGNVVSNMRRLGLTFGDAAGEYARINGELVRQAAVHGDRFALVRYEDLVLHPEPTLRALFDWLGEPWADDRLGDTERPRRRAGLPVDPQHRRAAAGAPGEPGRPTRGVPRLHARGSARAGLLRDRGTAAARRRGRGASGRASPPSTSARGRPSRSPSGSTTRARSSCAPSNRLPSPRRPRCRRGRARLRRVALPLVRRLPRPVRRALSGLRRRRR